MKKHTWGVWLLLAALPTSVWAAEVKSSAETVDKTDPSVQTEKDKTEKDRKEHKKKKKHATTVSHKTKKKENSK